MPLIELYDRKWNGNGCFRLELSHKSGLEGINEHDRLFFLREKKINLCALIRPCAVINF